MRRRGACVAIPCFAVEVTSVEGEMVVSIGTIACVGDEVDVGGRELAADEADDFGAVFSERKLEIGLVRLSRASAELADVGNEREGFGELGDFR